MLLSDLSIKRPVFASVLALLLVAFGVIAFQRLPLREFPDIDPPVVSVETTYRGAAANVVETRITEPIEERIAGVEGIHFIESTSENGRSKITITFRTERDIDAATNDIRDRVSAVLDDLPEEADPPEVQKVDSNDDVVLWLNLVSDRLTIPELSDYARRYLVDRFSVLDGVARVQVGGDQAWAMRIWIDRRALAARGLTVADVEQALIAENIELPAGTIESSERAFTIRTDRAFKSPEDFRQLALKRGEDGYLVRLGEVARVDREPDETRAVFRGNSVPMIGLGIIKQSTANTIDVARAVKAEALRLAPTLPEGMEIRESYDTSVFIEGAIREVYFTLALAIGLVVLVIYLFLGSGRATLVPSVTVPVSVIATFLALHLLGFTINILTLLALVLGIGILVDDAIIVLENIVRRMKELGETPLVAAERAKSGSPSSPLHSFSSRSSFPSASSAATSADSFPNSPSRSLPRSPFRASWHSPSPRWWLQKFYANRNPPPASPPRWTASSPPPNRSTCASSSPSFRTALPPQPSSSRSAEVAGGFFNKSPANTPRARTAVRSSFSSTAPRAQRTITSSTTWTKSNAASCPTPSPARPCGFSSAPRAPSARRAISTPASLCLSCPTGRNADPRGRSWTRCGKNSPTSPVSPRFP